MEIIEKRRVGRPRTTTVGINERVKRYRLAERCAESTPQVIALWKQMVEDKKLPYALRLAASDRLMDRAFGRPATAVSVDQTKHEMSLRKVVHEVRWLPPDPNDRSAYALGRLPFAKCHPQQSKTSVFLSVSRAFTSC
jgi:hypothetical protein